MTKEDFFFIWCSCWLVVLLVSPFLSVCWMIMLSVHHRFIHCLAVPSLSARGFSFGDFHLVFHLATPNHENYASLRIELTYEYADEMQVMINILIMICLQIVYINEHHSWHIFI